MKRFIIRVAIFISPIIIYLFLLEYLTGTIPNSYKYKYDYIKANGGRIEAIALGHSQLYDDFMPEIFDMVSFNLANSAQHYFDNYYIIKELLQYMPNLKVVIMPMGYINVVSKEKDTNPFTERSCYYHKYMNINYDGKLPLKYQFECIDPDRARAKIMSYYLRHIDIIGCDTLGRRNTHNLSQRQQELGIEKNIKQYTCESHDNFEIKDEAYLIKTIELLLNKNIEILFVSPPYYWNCFDGTNYDQIGYLSNYMKQLQSKYHVYYLNLENDTMFVYDDFFDETHLTEFGAEKFTKKLNNFIRDSIRIVPKEQ